MNLRFSGLTDRDNDCELKDRKLQRVWDAFFYPGKQNREQQRACRGDED